MAYQVIARKYRPQRFADVVGQEHVTQTLANAIAQGRIAHAYLFCGPRGTGKTTIARKYRPQRFEDVVGQEHVTQTLANAVAQKRIAHAYLFCGAAGRWGRTRCRVGREVAERDDVEDERDLAVAEDR